MYVAPTESFRNFIGQHSETCIMSCNHKVTTRVLRFYWQAADKSAEEKKRPNWFLRQLTVAGAPTFNMLGITLMMFKTITSSTALSRLLQLLFISDWVNQRWFCCRWLKMSERFPGCSAHTIDSSAHAISIQQKLERMGLQVETSNGYPLHTQT